MEVHLWAEEMRFRFAGAEWEHVFKRFERPAEKDTTLKQTETSFGGSFASSHLQGFRPKPMTGTRLVDIPEVVDPVQEQMMDVLRSPFDHYPKNTQFHMLVI